LLDVGKEKALDGVSKLRGRRLHGTCPACLTSVFVHDSGQQLEYPIDILATNP
jgi:hypothetical protein